MLNPSSNTDDLRALLERLYPDIRISGTAVALLAARIAEIDNRCEFVLNRIDHPLGWNVRVEMAVTQIWNPQLHEMALGSDLPGGG